MKSIVTYARADPTGASDSTAALQSALAAGGDWYWDAGLYKVAGPIPALVPGYHHGVPGATTIMTTSPTADILRVKSPHVYLSGLAFASAVPRTGGAYIDVRPGAHYLRLTDYLMTDAFVGLQIDAAPDGSAGSATLHITNGQISVMSGGTGMVINGGLDMWIDRLTMDGAIATAGILITGCGDLTLSRLQLLHAGTAINLQANGPGAMIQEVHLFDSMLDTSTYGVLASATGGGQIQDTAISGSWTSTMSQHGIILQTDGAPGSAIAGFTVSDHRALDCKANGFTACDAGCTDVHVDNLFAAGCLTGAAFGFVTPMTDFQIRGGKLGSYRQTPGNQYGLIIGAGCSNFDVDGVNCRGNSVAAKSIGIPCLSYYIRTIE